LIFSGFLPDVAENALLMDFADFAGGSLHLQRLYVFAFLPWQCQIASAVFSAGEDEYTPHAKKCQGEFQKKRRKSGFFFIIHNS
ncbi:MAG: hypothetical protein MSA27_06965, partial [Spirochaetia bacterium]|nr:hypothetical protein [Spirochaetia bacterium]